MELLQLQTFLAVAETEHFGQAAARLGIAQPAVSKRIKDLETELDVLLFDRLARGVRLSYAGRCFLDEARRVLDVAERARSRAKAASRGQHGALAVGIVDAMSWHPLVLRTIGVFRDRAPNVALRIDLMSSREQVGALREGRLDAGFMFNRATSSEAGFLDAAVASEHDVRLAVPAGGIWAGRGVGTLAELRGERFVLFPRATAPVFHDRIIAACRAGGLVPDVVQEAPHEAAVLGLVAAGVGVTIVNDALEHRKPASVVLIPVRDLSVPLAHELAWRSGDTSPALALLRSALDDARTSVG